VVEKKSSHFSSQSGDWLSRLTPTEKEIISLLSNEFLTVKQIAVRRKTSVRAVQKIVKQLRKKGVINSANKTVRNFQSTKFVIRLHGQEFKIDIIFKDERYKELKEKSNYIYVDGNTIRLSKDSIEVYSAREFFGDNTIKAFSRSIEYWNRFFIKLENQLKIIILKSRVENIKIVNEHYAEVNNELAQECEVRGERIKLYTDEDGKLWFTIDNSFNLHEAETLHPETAKRDMAEVIQPFFNDLRKGNFYTPSEMKEILNQLIYNQAQQATNIGKSIELENKLAINIKEHLKLVKKLNRAVDWVTEEKKYVQRMKEQKTLKDF
jgi:DNA-binding CsgD family transcriptional regulator